MEIKVEITGSRKTTDHELEALAVQIGEQWYLLYTESEDLTDADFLVEKYLTE